MNRRLFLAALFAITACAQDKKQDPALAAIGDQPGLPRVLIIGDSISIGYTLPVRQALNGKANVHRIPENGESTVTGLAKIDTWLGEGKWDVIHFNWGLHDLKQYRDGKLTPGAPVWVPVGDYEKNLAKLVERLKKTGAKLIFANTTPVPEGAKGRVPGIEKQYNDAAFRVMSAAGVKLNDLNSFVLGSNGADQLPRDVHFTKQGYLALSRLVVLEILAALPSAKSLENAGE
jgi:lysophospholipase L1-like esterase